jgi:hypothetical protein
MIVIDPTDFLFEDEVLKRWPMLTKAELRAPAERARRRLNSTLSGRKTAALATLLSRCRLTSTVHISGY